MRLFISCSAFLHLTHTLISAATPKTHPQTDKYVDKRFQEALTRKDFEGALEIARSAQSFENIFKVIAQATSYEQRLIVMELVFKQNDFEPQNFNLQSVSSTNALIALYDTNYLTELTYLMDCIPKDVLKKTFVKKHEKQLKENVINRACLSNDIFALWRLSVLLDLPVPAICIQQIAQLKADMVNLLESYTLLPKVVCQYLVDLL